METDIRDMVDKGLIEICRPPEKIAELIRSTLSYTSNYWYWLDWIKGNRN